MLIDTLITGAALTATGITGYGVLNRKSSILAPSIWCGPTDRPTIALTFDDGPSESTADILAILQRHQIHATFFQCGANVRRLPQMAQEVMAAGHELGNHTDSHPRLCFKTQGFIYREMHSAQVTIEQMTGARPRLFRAPFGLRWYGLRRAQQRLGLTGVMWTAIGYDWSRSHQQVVEVLRDQATCGAIICLHDGRELQKTPDITATVRALAILIPIWLDRGLRFETVTRMLTNSGHASNGELQANGECDRPLSQ
jgi:peptidoglycan-N-acetylglucosamine deacetylase